MAPASPISTGTGTIALTVSDAAKYSAVELLRNGLRIEIRALRASDRADLVAAVDHTSARSLYRRFFSREYRGMGARLAKWRAVIRVHGRSPDFRLRQRQCLRAGAVCFPLSRARVRPDRGAGSADGRTAHDRALRGSHRYGPSHGVSRSLRAARRISGDTAQAQHGNRRHGVQALGFRGGGRSRDITLLAPTRACRGTRNCLSVRRPKRTPCDCPSERNQPAAGHEALEDQFLIRASASRSRTRGLAWAGSGSAGWPAGPLPPGQSQWGGKCREVHNRDGGRIT